MIDFTSYVVPGVYVDTVSNPVIAPVGVDPTLVCLIGTGVGFNTYSESISFASSNAGVLSKNGIDPTSIVITGYIADPNATTQSLPYTFQADIPGSPPTLKDYSVTQTGTGTATVTTINRETAGKINAASYPLVTVSYHYTDASYAGLHFFTNYPDFAAAYGPALDPVTGNIVSPLTLAAGVAIQNGAAGVYAIALEGGAASVPQQFADAYALLGAVNTDANVVVPLWHGITDPTQLSGMLATLKAFIEGDANNHGHLRIAVVGFDQGYVPTTSALASLALGVSSSRVIMAWPNQLNFYNPYTTNTIILDGIYLGAAYAGILANQSAQTPLTRKYPQGFTGVPVAVAQTLTVTAKNQLSSSGVSVAEPDRNNRLVVRHGLTTNYAGGILNREISLVRAQDGLYQLIDQNLNGANLIGQPIVSAGSGTSTDMQVKSIVAGALETAITSGLINGYSGLVVREQVTPPGDPTVIEVQFAYKPVWPLNDILVSFTVDTSTGSSLTSGINVAGQNIPDQTNVVQSSG